MEKHKNLASARLAFQGEIKSLTKNSEVSFTGKHQYSYIDIAGVLDYVLPILTKHGILLEQYNIRSEVYNNRNTSEVVESHYLKSTVGIRTVLTLAETGEKVENELFEDSDIKDVRVRGSIITYLRRYSLLTVLGLSAEDDDAGSGGQQKPGFKKPESKPIDDVQAKFKSLGLDSQEAKSALSSVNITTMESAIKFREKFSSVEAMIAGITGGDK